MDIKKVLFIGTIAIYLTGFILRNQSVWTKKYDVEYWQDAFLDSQIQRGDKARNWMSDYDVYAILGYKYVNGEDPLALGNPEAPPLGKLMIGLSIKVFGNQNIGSLIFGIGGLSALYLLGKELFKKPEWAALPVLLLLLNGSFMTSLVSSNLDIIQTFFLIVSLLYLVKSKDNNLYYCIAMFMVGLLMATKYFVNGAVLILVMLIYTLIQGIFEKFIFFLTSLIYTIYGFIISYITVLVRNPDPISFVKFQLWLLEWWIGGAHSVWGSIFPMIFLGKWRTWWRGVPSFIHFNEWDITWPLLAFFGLISIVKIIKKKDMQMFLVWLWPATYLGFLTFSTPFPRYTLALFPFWCLTTVYLFKHD